MFKSTLNLERAKKLYEVFSSGESLSRESIAKLLGMTATGVTQLLGVVAARHNIKIIKEKTQDKTFVYKIKNFELPTKKSAKRVLLTEEEKKARKALRTKNYRENNREDLNAKRRKNWNKSKVKIDKNKSNVIKFPDEKKIKEIKALVKNEPTRRVKSLSEQLNDRGLTLKKSY